MPVQKFRKILHLDLDAFFCAVEEQRDPSLRGKPFAVGGRPDQRGVVASCSYAARRFGVRSALPMSQAIRLCPSLIIVPSRHGDYGKASRKVMNLLDNLTPLVEQISIDEAFLDVTMLRDDVHSRTGHRFVTGAGDEPGESEGLRDDPPFRHHQESRTPLLQRLSGVQRLQHRELAIARAHDVSGAAEDPASLPAR